jgi:hypothetical protein
MNSEGRTAWVFGDNIDTDQLAPGGTLKSGIEVVASQCMGKRYQQPRYRPKNLRIRHRRGTVRGNAPARRRTCRLLRSRACLRASASP